MPGISNYHFAILGDGNHPLTLYIMVNYPGLGHASVGGVSTKNKIAATVSN